MSDEPQAPVGGEPTAAPSTESAPEPPVPQGPPRRRNSLWTILALAIAIPLIVLGGIAYNYYTFVRFPPDPVAPRVEVTIEPGDTFQTINRKLVAADVIRNRWLMRFHTERRGLQNALKPGTYLLSSAMTPDEILNKLNRGIVDLVKVTIPEGFSLGMVATALADAGVVDRDAFIAETTRDKWLHRLDIDARDLEGFLFPETYRFRRDSRAPEAVEAMVSEFERRWTDRMHKRRQVLGFTLLEVVTLASIIERETGVGEERTTISSVFHNRLKQGMRLQSDPTVIYGLGSEFDGNLRRSDLRRLTPYNTYRIDGLPPGPICNPGLESMLAALFPAETDYLYFVSMNNGRHIFSKTYAEHLRNVNEYQR